MTKNSTKQSEKDKNNKKGYNQSQKPLPQPKDYEEIEY